MQWQISTDGGHTFTDISGATVDTLGFTASAADNGSEYQAVFTNNVGTAISGAATLTVDFAPAISTQPSNQLVGVGQTATFTATASAEPEATVQWQVSTDGGHTYSDITGATSTTLSITASAADGGSEYQAVFTNSFGTATSNAATLTLSSAPSITANPSNQTVTAGQTATFTASANGTPAATVQWQISTDGGTTFTNIDGATSTTLSFTSVATENGDKYQAVFTNSVGTATTSAATLTVDFAPSITNNPSSQTVDAGASVTFSAAASDGNPVPTTVQWQVSTDGVNFTNISGATSASLTLSTTAANNNNQYRAVFSNAAGLGPATQPATLSVNFVTITLNPTSQTVNAGQSVTFTAAASTNPSATVQWQVSTDGVHFTNIQNATSATLTLNNILSSQNGNVYRAVFTNSIGTTTATSNSATLTVNFAPTITTTGNPIKLMAAVGQTATFTAAATSANPAATVQWQVSTNNGSTFANIAGATSSTLSFTVTAATNQRQYRAVFTNSVGSAITSAAILTVISASTPVFTSANHVTLIVGTASSFTIATNASPMAALSLVGTLPSGLTFTDNHNGTATLSGTPAAGTAGVYHLSFLAFNGISASQTFTLTMNQPPVISLSPADQTVAVGKAVTFTAAASAIPAAKVQWQVSTDGGTSFKNIAGATSTTLKVTATVALNGAEYRAVFTNSAGSTPTDAATLTAYKTPAFSSTNHATFRVGTSGSFTVSASGLPTASLSLLNDPPDGLTFTDNGNGTATISGIPAAGTGGTFPLVILAMNDFGSATQTLTLTINQAPVITTQPISQTVTTGQKATFTAGVGANPAAKVQWQVSTNGGAKFTNLAGATSTTLSFAVSAAQTGYLYRAVFTNSFGTATTSSATLTAAFAPSSPAPTRPRSPRARRAVSPSSRLASRWRR